MNPDIHSRAMKIGGRFLLLIYASMDMRGWFLPANLRINQQAMQELVHEHVSSTGNFWDAPPSNTICHCSFFWDAQKNNKKYEP